MAVLIARVLGVASTQVCMVMTDCGMERTVAQLKLDVAVLHNLGFTKSWMMVLLMALR